MDKINIAILKQLKADGRMTWQKIGRKLKLTGQAVSARVHLMEHEGTISGYTIRQDNLIRHFVTVFMNNTNFSDFEALLNSEDGIEAAHKVTGEGCYHLHVALERADELEPLLNKLLGFARYRVLSAVKRVK